MVLKQTQASLRTLLGWLGTLGRKYDLFEVKTLELKLKHLKLKSMYSFYESLSFTPSDSVPGELYHLRESGANVDLSLLTPRGQGVK